MVLEYQTVYTCVFLKRNVAKFIFLFQFSLSVWYFFTDSEIVSFTSPLMKSIAD